MGEADLYAPVKAFLEAQGYAVKAEVRGCDVVGVRGAEPPVIVELKTRLTLELLLQGVDRLKLTDAVYLAVPRLRHRWRDVKALCRRLGLGLLLVEGRLVQPLIDPAPYRPRGSARRRGLLLAEFAHRVGDPNTGGTTRVKRVTAYRQDALRCLAALQTAGPLPLTELRLRTGVLRAASILQRDVYGWFRRTGRGVYAASPDGARALATYADIVATLSPLAEVA